jgi:3-dehydroquinate synthetase
MGHDKKARGGEVRWVFLEALGRATPGHAAPQGATREVIASLLATPESEE